MTPAEILQLYAAADKAAVALLGSYKDSALIVHALSCRDEMAGLMENAFAEAAELDVLARETRRQQAAVSARFRYGVSVA